MSLLWLQKCHQTINSHEGTRRILLEKTPVEPKTQCPVGIQILEEIEKRVFACPKEKASIGMWYH